MTQLTTEIQKEERTAFYYGGNYVGYTYNKTNVGHVFEPAINAAAFSEDLKKEIIEKLDGLNKIVK